ncbi:hypothetical protein PLICBS_006508 [Purpureocillium lilacinum]|uniref:uncharacterized protein n=1 Tax=Purpureocillium lilacinum TaxID=33203 RepID=UPI0020856643|nr:hypothetical protein PLICBS_006508 [Purpureocillium lilacinum]
MVLANTWHESSSSSATRGSSSFDGDESTTASSSQRVFTSEPLLELYYNYFHGSHPCVLPAQFFVVRMRENPPGMKLLLSVMRFIGSLYSPKVDSAPLENQITAAMAETQPWTSGYEIQALVLYSNAVFWYDNIPKSEELLKMAAYKAVAIGMNLKGYASEHSGGDPVLAESWRRTWWQLYCTDLHVAGTNHNETIYTSQREVACTVDLPCEESEYASGCIPPVPKTMEDYDNREFDTSDDPGDFSSYGYLVGLLRSFDHAVYRLARSSEANVKEVCNNTDTCIAAWVSLLSQGKRKLFREDGTFDELLFKGHTLLHVYTVDVHRQLSTLTYNPIESTSSCSPRPPPERLEDIYYREAPLHTAKILSAIEQMTKLLALPTNMSLHTPFTICMIATITIAHLSACKYRLRGPQLQLGRERIRVAVGALETFAETWPRGKKVLREIKIIAKELLRIGPENSANVSQPELCSTEMIYAHAFGNSTITGIEYLISGADSGSFDSTAMSAPRLGSVVSDTGVSNYYSMDFLNFVQADKDS